MRSTCATSRLLDGALLTRPVGAASAKSGDRPHPGLGAGHPAAEEVLEEWPRARDHDDAWKGGGAIPAAAGRPAGTGAGGPALARDRAGHATFAEPAYLADDDGIERVEPDGRGTRVTWESLRQVTLVRPTSEGWETVLFTGVHGDLRVPFGAMREALWDRVRRLPGADAVQIEAAIASAGPHDRLVWWQGMDTDPDRSV